MSAPLNPFSLISAWRDLARRPNSPKGNLSRNPFYGLKESASDTQRKEAPDGWEMDSHSVHGGGHG